MDELEYCEDFSMELELASRAMYSTMRIMTHKANAEQCPSPATPE